MNKKQLIKLTNKAVEASLSHGRIDSAKVTKFVKHFKALPLHEGIFALKIYAKGLKRISDSHTLFVYTPMKVEAVTLNKFKSQLKKDHTIENTEQIIDSSLLGGVMLKIGDTVYDNSLRSKIEQVKGAIRG